MFGASKMFGASDQWLTVSRSENRQIFGSAYVWIGKCRNRQMSCRHMTKSAKDHRQLSIGKSLIGICSHAYPSAYTVYIRKIEKKSTCSGIRCAHRVLLSAYTVQKKLIEKKLNGSDRAARANLQHFSNLAMLPHNPLLWRHFYTCTRA